MEPRDHRRVQLEQVKIAMSPEMCLMAVMAAALWLLGKEMAVAVLTVMVVPVAVALSAMAVLAVTLWSLERWDHPVTVAAALEWAVEALWSLEG